MPKSKKKSESSSKNTKPTYAENVEKSVVEDPAPVDQATKNQRKNNINIIKKLYMESKKYDEEIQRLKKIVLDFYNRLYEESPEKMSNEDDELYINQIKHIKEMNSKWLVVNKKLKQFTEECMNEVNLKKKGVEMRSHKDVHRMQQKIWIPSYEGEEPPPLCGAIPGIEGQPLSPKDLVATIISDKPSDDPILTVVKLYDQHTKLYTVFDPDAEAKIKLHYVPIENLTPFPLKVASGRLNFTSVFPIGSKIHCMYANTTVLYPGIVVDTPRLPDFMYKVCFEDEINSKFGYAGAVEIKCHHVIALKGCRSARPTATGTNTAIAQKTTTSTIQESNNAKNTGKSKSRNKVKSSTTFIPLVEPYPYWIRLLAGRLRADERLPRPNHLSESGTCAKYLKQELHEAFDMLLELGDSSDSACKERLARGQNAVNLRAVERVTSNQDQLELSEVESQPPSSSSSASSSPSPPPTRRRTKTSSRSKNRDKTWRC